ncbi:MAG: hypothetical protein LBQ04_03000 [Endomicrobium sp.]|jgi:hypothetical protein|nr:hypothetical protein [Endomicrobium sp.]
MARNRMIKPEFWEDEKVGQLSPMARLVFIGSLNFADDEGFIRWNERYISASIFPYDKVSDKKIKLLMKELEYLSFIEVFETKNHSFIAKIINFKKHQKIQHPTPSHFLQEYQEIKKKLKVIEPLVDNFLENAELPVDNPVDNFLENAENLSILEEFEQKNNDFVKKFQKTKIRVLKNQSFFENFSRLKEVKERKDLTAIGVVDIVDNFESFEMMVVDNFKTTKQTFGEDPPKLASNKGTNGLAAFPFGGRQGTANGLAANSPWITTPKIPKKPPGFASRAIISGVLKNSWQELELKLINTS